MGEWKGFFLTHVAGASQGRLPMLVNKVRKNLGSPRTARVAGSWRKANTHRAQRACRPLGSASQVASKPAMRQVDRTRLCQARVNMSEGMANAVHQPAYQNEENHPRHFRCSGQSRFIRGRAKPRDDGSVPQRLPV
jgi:hypothetical protein